MFSGYSLAQSFQLRALCVSVLGMHKPCFPILLDLSLPEMGKQISKLVTKAQWKIP